MKSLAENNLIRFTRVTKKKDGLYANFKASGIRGGTTFTAAIAVELAAAELNPAEDSLEKIIEECARIAERDIKNSQLQFEGIQSV